MYVGIGLIVPDVANTGLDHWADNGRSIARAIQHQRGNFRTLVDGTDKTAAVTIPLTGVDGIVIVAKDKSTLLTGLKVIQPGAKVSCTDANLGYVTGSYDREKVGAWLKTKFQAKKATGDFNAFDRMRLDERAYFVLLAGALTLAHNPKSVNLHESEIQLNSLPALISGKMTKDEAVDNLFQDLLIS